MYKDKGCGKVNLDNVDQVINLAGWVDSWRDHGSLLFLDLRDSTGTIQIVFDKSVNSSNHELASSIRNEWVIQVEGIVKKIKLKDTGFPQLASSDIIKHKVLMEYGTPKEFDGVWHIYQDVNSTYKVRELDERNLKVELKSANNSSGVFASLVVNL